MKYLNERIFIYCNGLNMNIHGRNGPKSYACPDRVFSLPRNATFNVPKYNSKFNGIPAHLLMDDYTLVRNTHIVNSMKQTAAIMGRNYSDIFDLPPLNIQERRMNKTIIRRVKQWYKKISKQAGDTFSQWVEWINNWKLISIPIMSVILLLAVYVIGRLRLTAWKRYLKVTTEKKRNKRLILMAAREKNKRKRTLQQNRYKQIPGHSEHYQRDRKTQTETFNVTNLNEFIRRVRKRKEIKGGE